MAVAFDEQIKYYAYTNYEGDDFGVGYLDTKEGWIERVNRWQDNDGFEQRFTTEDFEELELADMRGIMLADVEPIDGEYLVTWADYDDEFSVRISEKGELAWENNPTNKASIPQWLRRLKNTIREQKNQ